MERVSVGKVPELSGSFSSEETQAPRVQSELTFAILDGSSGVRSSLQFLLTALLNTFVLAVTGGISDALRKIAAIWLVL